MNEKALRVLEFFKVREMLVACAGSEPGKERCRRIEPQSDIREVRRMQTETADAYRRILLDGSISFSGLTDMRADIRRLEIGSSMSAAELLRVAKILSVAERVKQFARKDEGEGRGWNDRKTGSGARAADAYATDSDSRSRNDRSQNSVNGSGLNSSIDSNNNSSSNGDGYSRYNRYAASDVGEAGDGVFEDSLSDFFRSIEPLPALKREIERCILSEDEIADDASPELRRIRRQMASMDDRIHAALNELLNGSARTYLQDAIITQRDGRYCLPVKAEHRSQVPGMIHDQSASGSTVFIEPMAVVKLNNDMRELEAAEKKEIEKVLAALSSSVAIDSENLTVDIQVLTELDFIFARASLAKKMNASEPIFNECGSVDIKRGRHPLIDRRSVVPIDIWLGRDFDLLVISGPNTGGKTVSLKTIGLLEIMGLSGLHIPAAEHSELAMFTEIYADIGDEQSIEQSLSTFSSHMTNIVSFWKQADEKSLVLFDELGAGTDPTEGAALAIAILDTLHKRGIRAVATTHYSELKIYALSTPGVENACCEFDVETLRPTYRLLIGVPGKSNAFAISRKLGLPDEVIEEAKEHISAEQEDFEDVIADLDSRRVRMEKDEAEITRSRAEIERLRKSLADREQKLEESKEKVMEKARAEAAQMLRETKAFADETIRNYNRLGGEANAAREMEKGRTALREKMDKLSVKNEQAKKEKQPRKGVDMKHLHVGDIVHVISMDLDGTLLSLPDQKGNVQVQMGILHTSVPLKEIEKIGEPEKQQASSGGNGNGKKGAATGGGKIGIMKSATVSTEINLLGKTVDEAIPELDKYLDDAYIAHLPEVRIVHGKGTGALRKGVQNYLRKQKHVKSFRLGEFGEGDAGVTIVTFK